MSKDSTVVEFTHNGKSQTREYSKEVHGSDHRKLAEEFVETNKDKGAKIISSKPAALADDTKGSEETGPEKTQLIATPGEPMQGTGQPAPAKTTKTRAPKAAK